MGEHGQDGQGAEKSKRWGTRHAATWDMFNKIIDLPSRNGRRCRVMRSGNVVLFLLPLTVTVVCGMSSMITSEPAHQVLQHESFCTRGYMSTVCISD